MRKQTNLAEVKLTALALLSTEINETPYSPMIVKHPFTDTGVSAIPDGKCGVEMIDLTEDDAQLRWRQSMARQIDKADSAYAIYMMVTKPYALTFLKFAMPHLSREDMSQILASAWTRSEAPHQDVNVTVNQLLRMFKQADPTCLMEQDEYIQFKTLDDTVTVYRGVTPHNAKSVKALSWSLSQETAEWFAHRFGENGTVYEAQIDKKHIYAYFGGRNESEVIVDPSYLTSGNQNSNQSDNSSNPNGHRRYTEFHINRITNNSSELLTNQHKSHTDTAHTSQNAKRNTDNTYCQCLKQHHLPQLFLGCTNGRKQTKLFCSF